MSPSAGVEQKSGLNLLQTGAVIYVGVCCFHLAYLFAPCSFLMLGYLYSLASLARQRTSRRAFYFGLIAGLLAYAPQLWCFYTIFGTGAIALWLVLAFWIALFGLLARLCLANLGPRWAMVLVPFLWTGLEYFRSECYYLRFSWLNAGYAFSEHVGIVPFGLLGVYGVGFLLMAAAAMLNFFPMLRRAQGKLEQAKSTQGGNLERQQKMGGISAVQSRAALEVFSTGKIRICGVAMLVGLGIWTNLAGSSVATRTPGVKVAGVQMEFPNDPQVVNALNKLKKQCPDAELLVLSEYTFTEELSEMVTKWCRENQRYLVVGGKDEVTQTNFYDTAFVIDPRGEIVFKQGKSVPIQFFRDGLPAREQKLWDSPWGKIGICICYDLSYTKVTDRLVQLGAQALIVPTMDVVDWGRRQHELHARVAPVRAAEYGLPIFRMASSGISQLVDDRGVVKATAPFPGEDAMITGSLELAKQGRVPLDRHLAQASVWISALLVGWLAWHRLRRRMF